MIGTWQLVIILIIVFVLFGAGKLPSVMGDIGKGLKNFKKGLMGSSDQSDDKSDKI